VGAKRHHLGSTVLETNTSGTFTADQQYRAYGKQRDAGAVVTDHKFTGQKLDGTGLQYFNARYYDPAIGTFISPDTIVPDATNVFDYNRYMYTRGNPLKYNDPTGHTGIISNCMCGGGWNEEVDGPRIGASEHVKQGGNHLAANLAESVPYADTPNDVLVATTGCGYACQAGYEEPVGWGWRSVSALGVILPFGYRSIRSIFNLAEVGSEIVHAGRTAGRIVDRSTTRKGFEKLDILFSNRNDAMNWAKEQLGQSAERTYDNTGKWIGWINSEGDNVYWGHGDWYTGDGKSMFPHLNFNVDGVSGHLFLKDKISNGGLWEQFSEMFGVE